MAVVIALNRKRGKLKDQLTKLLSTITDEETMDIPQLEAQLEILKKVQEKFEDLKEVYYKSASDEEYLTIEASLSEIDQRDPTFKEPQVSLFANGNQKSVLINTAIIYKKNSLGKKIPLPGILDSGSESNIITTKAVDLLGLQKQRIHTPISGLNDCSLFVKNKVTTEISNQEGDEKWLIDLLVLPKITDYLPSRKINLSNLNIPDNLNLADSTFHLP
ncbi:DUF1758 domain-containing protein [Nephila pilipes]|uniref:DUF1758 domain-containing protein n=1 Tax=Nephila pilipes TaxID=299642 RepID=A0A8X6QX89_NEPPI|nr:DUF1758 domain-containing protein [Nephila pilipes]